MSLSVPFVIYQQIEAGNQFTKAAPEAGPERSLNGLIQKYKNRNTGGKFHFADNLFFEVKRIVADFGDATSWSIGIQHNVSDETGALETAFSELASASKQAVEFTVTGGADGDYTITINGTDYTHTAAGQTATQIATALQILIADAAVVATVDAGVVTVTSATPGLAFTYSSSSTGDPITENVTSENVGAFSGSQIRLDLIRQLLPTEAIVVETVGATTALSCEVLAFPTVSNYSHRL